jgi:hypothetical protein
MLALHDPIFGSMLQLKPFPTVPVPPYIYIRQGLMRMQNYGKAGNNAYQRTILRDISQGIDTVLGAESGRRGTAGNITPPRSEIT